MINRLKIFLIVFSIVGFFNNTYANENFYNEAKKKFYEKKIKDSKFLFQRNIVFNPKDSNSYLYLANPSTPSGTYLDISFCFD